MSKFPRESIHCPACNSTNLELRSLYCRSCDLEVKGRFEDNEFARLGAEELHFLRVFIHSEGKIKDMEKALGVSYPSVKAKLADLKAKLAEVAEDQDQAPRKSSEILELMSKGDLSYEEALEELKKLKEKE